jgi:hypothetical protein
VTKEGLTPLTPGGGGNVVQHFWMSIRVYDDIDVNYVQSSYITLGPGTCSIKHFMAVIVAVSL